MATETQHSGTSAPIRNKSKAPKLALASTKQGWTAKAGKMSKSTLVLQQLAFNHNNVDNHPLRTRMAYLIQ
jgi:hypothetical protein